MYEKSTNIYAHTSVPWQQNILSDLLSRVLLSPQSSCLDAGCGIGNNIDTILRYAQTVQAVDISEWAIDIAKDRYAHYGNRLQCSKMDVTKLDYENSVFDIVLCTEVLEHCLDPKAVLRECVRVLRPGGTLIVSSPNYMNGAGIMKILSEQLHPHEPWDAWGTHDEGRENFITTPLLTKWVKDSGLRISATRGGDIIRSWLPFLRKHYATIDRHPFLLLGRCWPFKLFMMNYFIMCKKD